MNEAEFRRLIASLELDAASQPAAYRLRTAALAALGYLYIGALLALCIGALLWALSLLAGGFHFGALKLLLVAGATGFLLVRALWVKFEAPSGLHLTAAEHPQLFEFIERVRKKCKGPELDEVLLTNDFNAAIAQTPRLGPLGWHRNSLILGLPLMQALSLPQFGAVLAHEFGHLAGAHGKFAAWIYRMRMTWSRMLESFGETDSWLERGIRAFPRWHIPYFQAYSYVLARAQEFEADRLAARVAGARHAGDALLLCELRGRFLDETFWPKVWEPASQRPQPALMPYAGMSTALRLGAEAPEAREWLVDALSTRTDIDDTHPSLRERLEALGHKAHVPPAPQISAAQALFKARLPALLQRLDRDWWNGCAPEWQARFSSFDDARRAVAELGRRDPHELDHAQRTRLGRSHLTLGEPARALPLLQAGADGADGTAEAAFLAGCLMLDREDARGIEYLELAMTRDGDLIEAANRRALAFCEQIGDAAGSQRYRQRLAQLAG